MGKIRGANSSPGIYTQITDLQYAADSLGITTLGLVGETLKGPAFEPIAISNWAQFQDYFGGTSTELFSGSKYPKYELPYIAKSYLSASDQLYVCRVLGLSGYDAGPIWYIKGDGKVIGTIRSKGNFDDTTNTDCGGRNSSGFTFYTNNIETGNTTGYTYNTDCNGGTTATTSNTNYVTLNYTANTSSQFSSGSVTFTYKDPNDKNYILNVIGTNPDKGEYPFFVESFYEKNVENVSGITITGGLEEGGGDILTFKTYVDGLVSGTSSVVTEGTYLVEGKFNYNEVDYEIGNIIRVTDKEAESLGVLVETECVYNRGDNEYYRLKNNSITKYVIPQNNYMEPFRSAVTPWFVSQLRGSGINSVNKLFRFYTISDGNAANSQIKITIANVRPDEGTFDVLVRDFYDTDVNQVVLESFKGLNMIPGSSKYIGLKIGTVNGDYPIKSKYIMADIIESETTETCVPCGFLGYPYIGNTTEMPTMPYNCVYKPDVRVNKQCFGVSDTADVDYFMYKGLHSYIENNSHWSKTTNGFHLDAGMMGSGLTSTTTTFTGTCAVDGEKLNFDLVNAVGGILPVFGNKDGLYADPKACKFTCYPCGGFDGWNIYAKKRSNGGKYKKTEYKGGFYVSGSDNENLDYLTLPNGYNFSDYYAYLAGIMQFSNPDRYTINLLATPGIDIINNTDLVNEAIEMVEERKDTFYIVTTPDRAANASDSVNEMYTPSDVVSELESTYIDSYYASTYYPWVRYFDTAHSKYINLPVTKDVVRNMADVDNKKYPWYAPAGIERGNVECNRARIFTKLADENVIYDACINPVKTFSSDGVKIWGNKTLYSGDTPMNRINTVRLVLYMRKLIKEAALSLIFEPNDTTLKQQFEGIIEPLLAQIKADRGITDYRLKVSQTPEQMDDHEISAQIHIKPTPTLEYIELDFVVTPQGVEWDE